MTEYDPLSLTLASLSWPSWQANIIQLHHDGPGVNLPEQAVSIYAVRSGQCYCHSDQLDQPQRIEAGDVVLLPHGGKHAIMGASDSPCIGYQDFLDASRAGTASSWGSQPNGMVPEINRIAWSELEAVPSYARVVCGHYVMQVPHLNPLNGHLSSFLHLRRASYPQLESTDALLHVIEHERRLGRSGWQAISSQLIQVVFHQALRLFVSQHQTQNNASPHAALVNDPAIGLVVGLLHSQLESPWTVASLARWVNMSRSAFSERFREVTGKPPLQYLTELRMERACQLLRRSDLGVKQIAAMVGYESPSSFTNAFKRWHGVSPATFRAKTTAEPCCV